MSSKEAKQGKKYQGYGKEGGKLAVKTQTQRAVKGKLWKKTDEPMYEIDEDVWKLDKNYFNLIVWSSQQHTDLKTHLQKK